MTDLFISRSLRALHSFSLVVVCAGTALLPAACFAAAGSGRVPECKLNLDAAAFLHGDEDAGDGSALVETAAEAEPSPPPGPSVDKCGLGSELIDTMKGSVLRIKFGSASYIDYYPLLLTDKNNGAWTCNKIKIRTACVVSQHDNGDGTNDVVLKTKDVKVAAQETIRVHSDGSIEGPPDGRFFVLMPRRKKLKNGQVIDRLDPILSAAERAGCSSSAKECKAKRDVFVERAAADELRRLRLPRLLSQDDRIADSKDLLELSHEFKGDERLVHLAIAASEIGWTPSTKAVSDSPFEIVDAILGNSGPSYGIHQIDLATNSSKDVIAFRRVMPAVLGNLPPSSVPSLQVPPGPIGAQPFKFEKPIRSWDIRLAADFYRGVPAMVGQIRTADFRKTYLAQYRTFLRSATGCMASLAGRGGIFGVSKVAQLYVLDVDNQFGSGRSVALARHAISLDASDPASSENAMRDYMIANTSYGSTPEGESDIRRRYANIQNIVGGETPAPTGDVKDCTISGLSQH